MDCGDRCILCREKLAKPTDRNFVDGKSKVREELYDLPFFVERTSLYICKRCLTAVKKRKALKEKLKELDVSLASLHGVKDDESLTTRNRNFAEYGASTAKKL